MADIYMHERLAEKVIKARGLQAFSKEIKLGSQGPDPLYYLVFSKDFKAAREVGDRLHDTRVNVLFKQLINYLKDHDSAALYAYVQGFFLHFALDTAIHPYVYHHVGVYRENDPKTDPMRGLHLKFERSIDKVLILEDHGVSAHRYNWLSGVPKVAIKDQLIDLYDVLVKATLGMDNGGVYFWRGVKGMRNVIRVFMNDRFGVKKKLYRWLDQRSHKQDLFYQDMSLYGPVLNYDFLNRGHKVWHHPVTNAPSTESVDALFQKAFDDAMIYLDFLERCIKTGQSCDVEALIKNRSFNSGIDCEDLRPMQYFNLFTPL